METLRSKQVPLILKIAVEVVFYNAWWSIEEFVIDHHGLWKYIPYYCGQPFPMSRVSSVIPPPSYVLLLNFPAALK